MSEAKTVADVRAQLSHGDVRLFRNNTGVAWQGVVVQHTPQRIVLANPRAIQFGLTPGSGDIIGLKSVTVTPDMVGQRLAVFVSLEGKSETGRVTALQAKWRDTVRSMGGVAGEFRSVDDAAALLGLPRMR